jgi:hypothetical protein
LKNSIAIQRSFAYAQIAVVVIAAAAAAAAAVVVVKQGPLLKPSR